MKAGDTMYLEPTNEMGEMYSEENGLTYDWDQIFHMAQRGQLEIQVGDTDPEHVPYVEEGEQLDEDPTVGGNLADIQRRLTELETIAETYYWNYEKYPDLKEYQSYMQEVMTATQILRRKAFELR